MVCIWLQKLSSTERLGRGGGVWNKRNTSENAARKLAVDFLHFSTVAVFQSLHSR